MTQTVERGPSGAHRAEAVRPGASAPGGEGTQAATGPGKHRPLLGAHATGEAEHTELPTADAGDRDGAAADAGPGANGTDTARADAGDSGTGGRGGGGDGGDGGGGDDEGDDGAGASWPRRAVAALAPQGPWQTLAGVLALCFLAGAVGYLVGTRQSPVPTSEVDVGFLADMSDHHDQAVAMALCTVSRAKDPVVQSMAAEVLVFQNLDLARMASLLEQMRVERPPMEGRTAMDWMGMGTPVASMPGMASPDELRALCSTDDRDLDRRFLTLMRAHHVGGIHMAEYAADRAANPSVRSLAAAMARNQSIEVKEYTSLLGRLGQG